MPRKTKRPLHKKHKDTKRKRGGVNSLPPLSEQQLDEYNISNTEVLLFLIDFLNKNNLQNIILGHHKFIDSIETQKLEFGTNSEFRKFVSDVIQWFLFDYNQSFSNCVLEIIKKSIENPLFLSKTASPDEKYNVLLLNVYNMIAKKNNQDDDVIVTLLRILLRALRLPQVKEPVITSLQAQQDNLIQFKTTIVCLLDNIIKKDLLHNEEIRKLLREIIEDLTYKNVYNWTMMKKLAGLITSCALSVTSNLTSLAAKGTYNATANAATGVYTGTANAFSSVGNTLFGSKK